MIDHRLTISGICGFIRLRNRPQISKGHMKLHSIYPEAAPSFPTTGEFTAWCAVSADREFSAVAWRVQRVGDDGSAVTEKKRSSGASSAPRAAIAGAIGIVESLPEGSTVEITSPDSFLVDAINNDLAVWSKAEWKKSDGKSVKNKDLFERLSSVIARRKLKVTSRRCAIGRGGNGQRLEHLQGLASELRKERDAA